jgi:hypothetical protein
LRNWVASRNCGHFWPADTILTARAACGWTADPYAE